jgi:hypothetical protein
MTTLSIALDGSSGACLHARQHHPEAPERMLPCAWPACEKGVRDERLAICRKDRAFPLLVERRSLVLAGDEQIFVWHPCQHQS